MTRFGQRVSAIFFLPGYGVLMAIITLLGIALSLTRPYLPLFATTVIGMSPALLGLFMAMSAIGGIVASTVLGKLSDTRVARKSIILLASSTAVLGYAAFLFVHNYWLLTVASTVLLGIAAAAFPQMFAYAREAIVSAQSEDAVFAISTLRSFFSLAWVIGPVAGAWAVSATGFDGMFTSTTATFLLVVVLVMFFVKRRQVIGVHVQRPAVGMGAVLRQSHVRKSVFAFTAFAMSNTIFSITTPLFVTHNLHGSNQDVGIVVSLSAGLEIPVMIGLGALAERISHRTLLAIGCVCGILYYVCVAFTTAPWQVFLVQIFNATYVAIFMSIGMSYFQDFLPDAPGTATTLYSNTSNLGNMIGSLLAGGIAQVFGYRAIYWACALLGIFTLSLLLQRSKRTPAIAHTHPDISG